MQKWKSVPERQVRHLKQFGDMAFNIEHTNVYNEFVFEKTNTFVFGNIDGYCGFK
jgi:hypothetical protein